MINVSELSRWIRVNAVIGNKELILDGLNLCNRPTKKSSIISYATNDTYVKSVQSNSAIKCLIVSSKDSGAYEALLTERKGALLVCDDPEYTFFTLHNQLYFKTDFYPKWTNRRVIGKNPSIHETAVICDGTILGDNVIIGANTVIKPGSIIDDYVEIGCNSTIGSEGFQTIKYNCVPLHIKHIGQVHLCNGVYVGDNTAICINLFDGETYVGENTKIDNLVHIAHNCFIGRNCVITAGTILCGSSILEDGAWIGVNSSILNKVTIGQNALIGIGSVVTRDIDQNSIAYGVPAKQRSNR